jgi:decaprenylphospho-beta-D-ribofuranose 2-oxidase
MLPGWPDPGNMLRKSTGFNSVISATGNSRLFDQVLFRQAFQPSSGDDLIELAGWGRYPRHQTAVLEPADPSDATRLTGADDGFVARGNGRAYGDAAIGLDKTLLTRRLNRMISFDPSSGRLEVEAGVLLADILDFAIPRGFFPPVVPGTKFVSVGGMIAADVHGKNHHVDGSFGRHVEKFDLALPDGRRTVCSAHDNSELFLATIGGMGLTGTILSATFALRRIETSLMRQRTIVAANLDAALGALETTLDATYSVAWIDCLARGASTGRALVYRGEHACAGDLPDGMPAFQPARKGRLKVPFDMPSAILSRPSVTAFNEVYFRRGAAKAGNDLLVGIDPYFFPLDGVGNWNRIYGARGFVQHQCVIPKAASSRALAEILDRIRRLGSPSFLAVLKLLGAADGLLSFPMEGYTLALDFPASRTTLQLLDDIDRILVAAGGRIYLAKDARQQRATFESGYADALPRFRGLRRDIGAAGKIESQLSRRLAF